VARDLAFNVEFCFERHQVNMLNVAIIGAGPYGLSIAAHLKARGIEFRLFGTPMQTWLKHMPRGMRLKSEGFASSLFDPASSFTLAHYCHEKQIPYADLGLPVALETFCGYGLEFQRRFVPDLESKHLVSLKRTVTGFQLGLDDGQVVCARKVIIAVGLSHFEDIPPVFSGFPEELVTHSSKHSTVDRFNGRTVAVVGAGASALDLAALLHKAGASVQLISRKPAIRFHDPPGKLPRPLWERLRFPISGIGEGWELLFCAKAPLAFRCLPERRRLEAVGRILGPAPGWFIKEEVAGKVPFNLAFSVSHASIQQDRVSLELTNGSGPRKTLLADHVIAATGYKVELDRLRFLSSEVLAGIKRIGRAPALSSSFQCSIPGLYFVGTSAANTFGPLMRFAVGAGFAARRLTAHLAGAAS
jgi:hypothetical protein